MEKYHVYAAVTGGKYIGEFEARSKKDAIEQAMESDEASVRLCHQCSPQCEDAETHKFSAEKSD